MNIVSASVDHHKLNRGLHLWEEVSNVKGLYLYDLRFKKPVSDRNTQDVLSAASMHSMEHFLAFYLRQVESPEKTLSLFPYGCQTGFGCLSFLKPDDFKRQLISAIKVSLQQKEIPFSSTKLCGNIYLNDIDKAKLDLREFMELIESQPESELFNTPRV